MQLRILLFSGLLLAGTSPGWQAGPPREARSAVVQCPGTRPRVLLGLLPRPLTPREMADHLERGCLALDEVRFRPGADSMERPSPGRLIQVARALGMAHGAYRVSVPPETAPGWPPDTVQARRRGSRLREELVHYGASLERLLEDPHEPNWPSAVAPGTARPMLVRVPDPSSRRRWPEERLPPQ